MRFSATSKIAKYKKHDKGVVFFISRCSDLVQGFEAASFRQ